MNIFFSFIKAVRKNSQVVFGGVFLAALTLVSLFAFEAASRAQFADEAFAWSCEAFDAEVGSITQGDSTTLTWSFEADSNVYVTIDQIPGEKWTGTSGSVQVKPSETTKYKAVAHKEGTDVTYECWAEVKVTVPTPEPTPKPTAPRVPACPYTASANVTVVDFNGGKTRDNASALFSNNSSKYELTASKSLPAGTYTIKTASWDGYLGRESVTQPKEQWNVEVRGGVWKKGPVGPTTDIEDRVVENSKKNTFANAITLTEAGTSIAVVHAAKGDKSSPNSVVPICVAFEKQTPPTPPKEDPRVPACPYTASANVTVVDFNGGKARSDATLLFSNKSSNYEQTVSQTLPAGTYTVKTASWDGYVGRESVTQPREQWNVEVRGASWKKGPVGPTTDIADRVIENTKNNTFANALVLTETGSTVAVRHAFAGNDSTPNSVVPICVAFEKKSDHVDPVPSCTMDISSSRVKKGETVTLNWSSKNTSSASIDQGIGSVSLDGSKNIVINKATTFTGVFKDSRGKEVTCSASVSIRTSGGGGSCLNCDRDDDEDEDEDEDDDPKPTVVLGKTITKTGSYITLDQVPYTGFEAGPMLTTFFWLMVLALSVLIAYISTRYQPLTILKTAFAFTTPTDTESDDTHVVEYEHIQESVMAPVRTPIQTPVRNTVTLSDVPTSSQGANNTDAISIIEDMAHKENILLSPEALRLMYAEVKSTDSSPTQYLTGLFEIAKTEYPQEDGWILLSKERAEKLLGKSQNNTVLDVQENNSHAAPSHNNNNVLASAEPKAFRVEQKQISKKNNTSVTATHTQAQVQVSGTEKAPTGIDENAIMFIDSLVNLEKKKVFDILRSFASRGNDVGALMTAVVRKLDEVYRYRVEGGQTPNKEIAGKTATWSNGDFENVLGILVECIDYTYANNQIGTKVALTKAFEHFEKKA